LLGGLLKEFSTIADFSELGTDEQKEKLQPLPSHQHS
jgi:hypothetical protein